MLATDDETHLHPVEKGPRTETLFPFKKNPCYIKLNPGNYFFNLAMVLYDYNFLIPNLIEY